MLKMSQPIEAQAVFPYVITVSRTGDRSNANGSLSVRLAGPQPIKGFLLYCEHVDEATGQVMRVGEFLLPPFRRGKGVAQYHFLAPCNDGKSTITHVNPFPKHPDETTFLWNAPVGIPAPVTFRAAVLVTHTEWYIIESQPLDLSDVGNDAARDLAVLVVQPDPNPNQLLQEAVSAPLTPP
ncbi:Reelin domain-containing protein [Plasmodiophora brassicae]